MVQDLCPMKTFPQPNTWARVSSTHLLHTHQNKCDANHMNVWTCQNIICDDNHMNRGLWKVHSQGPYYVRRKTNSPFNSVYLLNSDAMKKTFRANTLHVVTHVPALSSSKVIIHLPVDPDPRRASLAEEEHLWRSIFWGTLCAPSRSEYSSPAGTRWAP